MVKIQPQNNTDIIITLLLKLKNTKKYICIKMEKRKGVKYFKEIPWVPNLSNYMANYWQHV